MDYPDIQERLTVLNEINLSQDRDRVIGQILQNEMQKSPVKSTRRPFKLWNRIGYATVAVIAVIFAGVILQRGGLLPFEHRTPATQITNVTPIHYSSAELAQIRSISKRVGIDPYLPQRGLVGDRFTSVENSGRGSLILDYRQIWLQESAAPLPIPQEQAAERVSVRSGTTGEYITTVDQHNRTHSFFQVRLGKTYILMENNVSGKPFSKSQAADIAKSMVVAKSLTS